MKVEIEPPALNRSREDVAHRSVGERKLVDELGFKGQVRHEHIRAARQCHAMVALIAFGVARSGRDEL